MPSVDWELGFLGQHGHGHGHGHGGGGAWYGGPTYYEEPFILPMMAYPECPPKMIRTVAGTCVPIPKEQLLGQFNPVQSITQAAMQASGVNPANIQKDVQNIEQNVEMYAYAQLGLQTVAAAATFGLFLMMFYKFLKERKRGAL